MGNDDELNAEASEADGDDIVVRDPVTAKIVGIVAEVLGLPKHAIGPETAAADVEGWDSFGHVRIVLAVDRAFGIELSMGAIERADSIQGLVDVVEEALGER